MRYVYVGNNPVVWVDFSELYYNMARLNYVNNLINNPKLLPNEKYLSDSLKQILLGAGYEGEVTVLGIVGLV